MDPEEKQHIIQSFRKRIRQNNWDYLCRHPEIRAFVRVVLNEAIKEKPKEIYDFTANLFRCENMDEIVEKVNEQMKRVRNLSDGVWNEYAGDMRFSETSVSSIFEQNSTDSLNDILKFVGIDMNEDLSPPKEEKEEKEEIEEEEKLVTLM